MRKFEKISFEQFKKDISEDKELYEKYTLPKRSTKHSAGYDICALKDEVIKPKEAKVFATGLKVCMNDDEVLYLYTRSSFGYKYCATLANSVGVIDSDFYNNPDNEGHFKVKIINHGDKDIEVKAFDRIAQAVFMKYLTVDDEEEITNVRAGGIGSTNKED